MFHLFKAATGAALSIGLVAGSVTAAPATQDVDAAFLLALVAPDVTIELSGTEDGAPDGQAILAEAGEQTEVTIQLSGVSADAGLTAYLVSGTCTEGEVIAQLGAIEVDEAGNGELHAALPVTLERITSEAVAVAVHAGDDSAEAVSCGAHVPAAEVAPEPGA
jgi:ketosteroid isomerase-like protein